MQTVTVGELYCPFPPRISVHVDAVDRHTVEWARAHGLLRDAKAQKSFTAGKYGTLAARNHPDAEPDLLNAVADWYSWLFLFDDWGDEASTGTLAGELRGMSRRFLQILDGPHDAAASGEPPFERSLRELAVRLADRADARWMNRFVESCAAYFDSLTWEAQNRAAARTPDAHRYAEMRRHTGAVGTSFVIGELADGLDVPTEVLQHPAVEAITEVANNIVCWQNDLLSFSKEMDVGEVHNFVVVTRKRDGGSLQEAADTVAARHDEEMRTFVEMCRALPSFEPGAQQQLDGVVSLLQHWVRGNLDWSRETGRYQASVGF